MGRIDAGGVGRFTAGGDTLALQQVEAIIDDISAGWQVSPDAVKGIKNMLANLLRSGAPTTVNRAQSALLALDRATTNPVDRGEMIGYAIVVGEPQGGRLFDALINQGAGKTFSQDDLSKLRASLGESLINRLKLIVNMLGVQMGNINSPKNPREPRSPQNRDAISNSEKTRRRSINNLQDQPNIDGDWHQHLRDSSRGIEQRLAIVHNLGRVAVRSLEELIHHDDHREFATLALIDLGHDQEMVREVHQLAWRLEFNPDTRPVGEMIRRALEQSMGTAPRREDPQGTIPSFNMAKIGEGLLQQALDACDQPNLLLAAAGREAVVIPRVLRRLVEMRTKQ